MGATCPWCGKDDKFGIKFNDFQDPKYMKYHVAFNCFRGKCKEHGTEFKLMKKLDMLHLILHGEFLGEKKQIDKKIVIEDDDNELDLSVPKRHLPVGFRRVDSDEYLVSRGFLPWQFEVYNIGRTRIDRSLKNYVLFSVVEDGENKGYIARLTLNDKEISKFVRRKGYEPLRYNNEGGVDFGKLLFGIDEIMIGQTKSVILVEGITDKANVDRLLELNTDPTEKCLATFGKKISIHQIMKLWMRGIENIVILYDPDAVNEAKKYGQLLKLWFKSVKIGYLSDKDPGDLNLNELELILENLRGVDDFSSNVVQKKILR